MFEDGSSVISFHNSYAVLVSPSQVHIKNISLKREVSWNARKSRIYPRDSILISLETPKFQMPYFTILKVVKEKPYWKWGISKKKHVTSFKTEKGLKLKPSNFGEFQWKMPSRE